MSGGHTGPTRQDGMIILITDYTAIVVLHPGQTHFSQEAAQWQAWALETAAPTMADTGAPWGLTVCILDPVLLIQGTGG